MGKKKYNPEWNKKRKIITVSFNDKELKLFEKKYGDVLSGWILKEMAFKKKVTIHHVHFIHDQTKHELLFQLKKIGNNLNQIAWKVQINPNHISGLENQLKEVEKVLKKVEDLF